jgi:hypothetical protein
MTYDPSKMVLLKAFSAVRRETNEAMGIGKMEKENETDP